MCHYYSLPNHISGLPPSGQVTRVLVGIVIFPYILILAVEQ